MSSNNGFVDHILKRRWLSHLVFWGGLFFILTLLAILNTGGVKQQFINYLTLLPFQMMAAYTLVYYQVPKLLLRKKYLLFFVSFLFFIYFFSVLARLGIVHIAEPFIRTDFEQESVMEIVSDPYYLLAVYAPAIYVTAFLMLAVKMILERFREKHDLEVLRKEKVTNELKFLKTQIHPHFLFNTLNNLYALTLTKSDTAPVMVLKLADMLDYILYQCNVPRISIDKEIELIRNYIDLEKLRYGEQLDLDFSYDLEDEQAQIAPLILLALIENAFKHGTGGQSGRPEINISLKTQNERLSLSVFNTKPKAKEEKVVKPGRNSIGLPNVKRQLTLDYPNKHNLEIREESESYLAVLTIDLSKD
ncbi:sensor histidine kinase [Poritiphilus flavus]|uniref:Histidine kinase n=1 Tax=Poritiphilus flavus TaxID=2697053 RepID=A0A6L9EH45_9FLAO|nr:histidine kinase [Poritiphilus flavus]NAS13973.1 histidine kinase [Poritiphilus flavus]